MRVAMANPTGVQEVLFATSSWKVVAGSWGEIVSTSCVGPREGSLQSPCDVGSERTNAEVSTLGGSASADRVVELEAADSDCLITCNMDTILGRNVFGISHKPLEIGRPGMRRKWCPLLQKV